MILVDMYSLIIISLPMTGFFLWVDLNICGQVDMLGNLEPLPRFLQISIAHEEFFPTTSVECHLSSSAPSGYKIIIQQTSNKEFPSAIMVASIEQAAWLICASIGMEIGISNICSNAVASKTTVCVDHFDVNCVIRMKSSRSATPTTSRWIQSWSQWQK